MKTFDQRACYVWAWLPNHAEPLVCGKLQQAGNKYEFFYASSYMQLEVAIPLAHNMPLGPEIFTPKYELSGAFSDSLPDAWGRRVLNHHYKTLNMSPIDMLLLSSTDRIGALHFQNQPSQYQSHDEDHATIEQLRQACEMIEKGETLPKSLDVAIAHGTSVGGARPKALIDADDLKYIAKFSSSTDFYPIVKAEFAVMWLAGKIGLDVAKTKLIDVGGKSALLVNRFDREKVSKKWRRKFITSALTLLELDEIEARYASYLDVADSIRKFNQDPRSQLLELYRRMVFNILVGNTDDHAKNHAFFWDGESYKLTPAYDICAYPRAGQEATQAMIIGELGAQSTLKNALSGASYFLLDSKDARHEIDQIYELIKEHWSEAAQQAKLTNVQKQQLENSSILNPYCFYGY